MESYQFVEMGQALSNGELPVCWERGEALSNGKLPVNMSDRGWHSLMESYQFINEMEDGTL